jgi:transposase InsO family protein
VAAGDCHPTDRAQNAAETCRPDELVARGPNQVYSWDITFLRSTVSGMFFYLYLFMDVYSRKIVGFEVHEEQSSDLSADMLRKICISEGVGPNRVVLHADNGGPMKGATMLATMQRLGVVPSFSRPSVSDDNPFSEALFKTLKYCPQFPSRPFEPPEEAREWVRNFVRWYNEEHMHSGKTAPLIIFASEFCFILIYLYLLPISKHSSAATRSVLTVHIPVFTTQGY